MTDIAGSIFLGADVGGNMIGIAGCDADEKPISDKLIEVPTLAAKGPEATARSMREGFSQFLEENGFSWDDVARVGIAFPSPIVEGAILKNPSNLRHPDFTNLNAKERFGGWLEKEVEILNDADADARHAHERYWGEQSASRTSVIASPGTGLATSIVYRGEIVKGRGGVSSEGGHAVLALAQFFEGIPAPVDGGPGNKGRVELWTCLFGLQNGLVRDFFKYSPRHPIHELLAEDEQKAGSAVLGMANEGDRECISLLCKQAGALGHVLAVNDKFVPADIYLIGGGISQRGSDALCEHWMTALKTEFMKTVHPKDVEHPFIEWIENSDLAQALGAAFEARQAYAEIERS